MSKVLLRLLGLGGSGEEHVLRERSPPQLEKSACLLNFIYSHVHPSDPP